MESSRFVLDLLEHCQRVGPEHNTVDGKIELRPDEVAGSDCHKARHELEARDGWSPEGCIAAFAEDKGAVCLVTMVIAQS